MSREFGDTLGVVVVGVGRAGKVRIRDITNIESDGDRQWKLLGYVSRRKLGMDGLPQLTEEEMLQRTDVHAVIICSEPEYHEYLIRKALHCKKHVLVEYPVALSLAVTNELYQLAAEKGLVLHEENIALLTEGFATVQEKLQNAGDPLVRGEIKVVGSYDPLKWSTAMAVRGRPFCASVSMIQTLYELLGGEDLVVTGGQFQHDVDTSITATAMLSTPKCRDLKLIVHRTNEMKGRQKTIMFELEDGTVLEDKPAAPTAPVAALSSHKESNGPKIGLFMKDFLLFVHEVNGQREYSNDTARTRHCIQLAEQIHSFMGFYT